MSFRRVSVLRGGMDPSEMQRLRLDTTVFDESLPWEVIDRHVNRIRTGEPIPQDELQTWPARLAQVLASLLALQQWDALAAFWQTQPPEVTAGSVLSPAGPGSWLCLHSPSVPNQQRHHHPHGC